jgi:hypothetical protein
LKESTMLDTKRQHVNGGIPGIQEMLIGTGKLCYNLANQTGRPYGSLLLHCLCFRLDLGTAVPDPTFYISFVDPVRKLCP